MRRKTTKSAKSNKQIRVSGYRRAAHTVRKHTVSGHKVRGHAVKSYWRRK